MMNLTHNYFKLEYPFRIALMLTRISLCYLYWSSSARAFSASSSLPCPRHLSTFQFSRGLGMSTDASSYVGLSDIGAGVGSTNENQIITTWREKIVGSIARSRKVRGGNYVQIATVDPDTLEPRCRTVVFRGFLKKDGNELDVMKMITDKRSSKFSEASFSAERDGDDESSKSTCEMVWWFGKSSEQYRIRGQLKFVGGDESDALLLNARKEQWGNMSDPAREQFFWKEPGLPFDSQADVPEGGRDGDGKVLPPPENFLLMLLYPKRCDYLRLGDNFRQIDNINEDKSWSAQQVTP